MHLAILVVYVFDDARLPLFEYHLARLRRHTDVPFRIFAAAHKVTGAARHRLGEIPEITVVDCTPPVAMGVRDEHSYCLDRLAAHAADGPYSHFSSLHLDSFPVRDGWAQAMADTADDAELSAIVPNGYSAGLFWTRAFYETHKPSMLVPADERETARFQRFKAAYPTYDHVETGLGYIYAAWRDEVPWRAVTTDGERKIYEGLLFHLVAGTWRTWSETLPIRRDPLTRAVWPVVCRVCQPMPRRIRARVREWFADKDRVFRDGSVNQKRAELAALVRDPDAFVSACQRAYRGPNAASGTASK